MQLLSLQRFDKRKHYAQKFGLWIALVSLTMMFAGFTSAYIVKKSQNPGLWLQFAMPAVFYLSTLLIVLSSLTIALAGKSLKKASFGAHKLWMRLTLLLGLGFVVTQFMGWAALKSNGVFLNDNVSGSFFYIISGAHAAHVIGGIVILMIYLSRRRRNRGELPPEVITGGDLHKRFKLDMVATYWHFVDILWIYLFVFLLANQS